MSGTFIAQLIPILVSPILARLYTPEDFGVLGVFISLVIILSIIGTGRFELALFLPKRIKTVNLITKFIIIYSSVISFVLLIFISIYTDEIMLYIGVADFRVVLFIPFAVFIYSLYIILRSWLNRKEEYEVMRTNYVLQTLSISSFQMGFAPFYQGIGLVFGDLIGKLLTVILIAKKLKFSSIKLSLYKVKVIVYRYRNIPLYQVPAAIFNNAAIYVPTLILPSIFNLSASGAYFFIFRIVMAPIAIFGNALLEVFKVDASKAISNRGECRAEFIKVFKILFVLGCGIFLCVFFIAKPFVDIVFGDDWQQAGELSQALALLAASRFIASPLSYLFILREKNKTNMLFQACFFIVVLISLYIGYIDNEILSFAYMFSFLSCFFYIIQIYYSYKLSGNLLC